MNRRNFFKWLGAGTAAAAAGVVVAPSVIEKIVKPKPSDCDCALRSFWDGPCKYHLEEWRRVQASGEIGSYADYSSFASFASKTSIDEAVGQAAADLGHQAGLHVSDLWRATFGG